MGDANATRVFNWPPHWARNWARVSLCEGSHRMSVGNKIWERASTLVLWDEGDTEVDNFVGNVEGKRSRAAVHEWVGTAEGASVKGRSTAPWPRMARAGAEVRLQSHIVFESDAMWAWENAGAACTALSVGEEVEEESEGMANRADVVAAATKRDDEEDDSGVEMAGNSAEAGM
jgi:hypothetical protein